MLVAGVDTLIRVVI